MTTTLFFLVPIGLLAIAWSLCFVGCIFQTSGLKTIGTMTTYSDVILAEPNLIAYWPLSDLSASTTAADLSSGHHHNGTYTSPPAYPPTSVVPDSTPIASPSHAQQQPSIVEGDAAGAANQNPMPFSVNFNGDYVSIPWSTQTNLTQLDEFTIEAWLQPGWTPSDPSANYVLFDSRSAGFKGFGVFVNTANQFEISVGNGTVFVEHPSSQTVDFGTPTYVAVTCDSSGTVALWVNPLDETQANQSFNNSQYVAVATNELESFFIGAGAPNQALRTQPNGTGAPSFPFVGFIQDVALYKSALTGTDILTHFANGSGFTLM